MTAPTQEAFLNRIPFGSLTNYGIFDRFEQWLGGKTYAVFKTKSGGTGAWPIKGEVLTALDAKLIGGEYSLDKVVTMTPEQLAQAARETQSHISSFYEARPDLLND
jgi:hypothetical protein